MKIKEETRNQVAQKALQMMILTDKTLNDLTLLDKRWKLNVKEIKLELRKKERLLERTEWKEPE